MAQSPDQVERRTLAARWLEKIQNNRAVAGIVVAGTIVGAVLGAAEPILKMLPPNWEEAIIGHPKATNGWAFAGYLDKDNLSVWGTGPFVDMVRLSPGSARPYPIRIGDTVAPNKPIPQTVIDYRTKKFENVLVPPPQMRGAIRPDDDYTGTKFEKDKRYIVADVRVGSFPGQDAVVWLPLTPAE